MPMSRPTTDVDAALARYRPELTAYCYRMLGSTLEAEDAVQDTLLRAWRGFARFEGRSELRAWLYRIATNVCLDALHGRARRALPIDLGPAADGPTPLGAPLEASRWIEPIPDRLITGPEADPAELVTARETIRLAFIAALQHLGPRQRAVLILRDVLRWRAAEVAEILGTSTDAVNSTLRRARGSLTRADRSGPVTEPRTSDEALLARYVDAFQRFDIDALVALLREDAAVSMPPYPLWLRGRAAFAAWLTEHAGSCSPGRVVATRANGCPAIATYHPTRPRGPAQPAIHVLEPADGRIAAVHVFMAPGVFGLFHRPGSSAVERHTTSHKPVSSRTSVTAGRRPRSRNEQPDRPAASCSRARASTERKSGQRSHDTSSSTTRGGRPPAAPSITEHDRPGPENSSPARDR
jgi:RNA polymerase sigma-70 factor (ECF subfamily)